MLNNKKIELIVEHKADLNYPSCSASSILAKCAREEEIKKIKKKYGETGSGYSSDPYTVKFLKENYNKYPEILRKTWATYKKIIDEKTQKNLREF